MHINSSIDVHRWLGWNNSLCISQVPANCSLQAKYCLLPVFCKLIFWGHSHEYLFMQCLWLFFTTTAEISSCNRASMSQKAWNILGFIRRALCRRLCCLLIWYITGRQEKNNLAWVLEDIPQGVSAPDPACILSLPSLYCQHAHQFCKVILGYTTWMELGFCSVSQEHTYWKAHTHTLDNLLQSTVRTSADPHIWPMTSNSCHSVRTNLQMSPP